MTREEAISVLKVLASFQGVMEYLEQHSVSVQDACNMAIQALSQEPIDAISREAVIEWLKAKDIIKLSSQEETARKELKALPPVTPQQKYGKWITHRGYNADGFGIEYSCSKCNEWVEEKSRYCPNCGAKMESEVQE